MRWGFGGDGKDGRTEQFSRLPVPDGERAFLFSQLTKESGEQFLVLWQEVLHSANRKREFLQR